MAKKEMARIKLQIKAGQANPAPPIGPALGQRGVNIMDFCKSFNAQTKDYEQGIPLTVVIVVYADKTFKFSLKSPPVSYFIKKYAGITSGSKATGRDAYVGKITRQDCLDIAKEKLKDLNTDSLEEAGKIVMGSARSMGVEVLGG